MPTTNIQVEKIPFEAFPQLSKKDIAYYNEHSNLRPFYKYPVNLKAFNEVIKDKQKDATNRALLIEALTEQYKNINLNTAVQANINALADENTFTVITAHQPSLFTGPLYYIYKIISIINLAETLNEHYNDYRFVPVFVTGGEDHDFEEVNHARIFNNVLTWKNDESGSVGMMQTQSLSNVLAELKNILGNSENAEAIYNLIHTAYTKNETYALGTIEMVHELFKEYGLVVCSMNNTLMKGAFKNIIKKEVLEQVNQPILEEAHQALIEAGFSGQSHARKINFFYLRDQLRKRIVFENNQFKVLDTDFTFSPTEMEEEINKHPERFSPNVIMRPLYQERIFPNLAYIGGGGELAYWLERKKQFEYFGLNFPMLIRRNSVLWIDKGNKNRMDKLGVDLKFLLQDTHAMEKAYVKENTETELSLKEEKKQISEIFNKIAEHTKAIDPTLVKTVKAEMANHLKSVSQLEGRLIKAEKQRHEITINQLNTLQERLFPSKSLQERKDNFIPFYLKHGRNYFNILKKYLHPLEKGLVVISEN